MGRKMPIFLLLLLSSLLQSPLSTAYTAFTYGGCSQQKYQPDPTSPFQINLNSFLASVVSSASEATYNSFAAGNITAPQIGVETEESVVGGAIYGFYQCRGDLKVAECSVCVRDAVEEINLVCPYSYGAALQLEGCYVRYEHFDFLGQADMNLRFKKCSKRVENDADFFRRRDDVLSELKAANGFRLSSSGMVQGFAQCMGDLSYSDCSSCLSEAVRQIKTVCDAAVATDIYLGQCYARYWVSGYYDISTDSHHDEEVSKTVAIIVGGVVGLTALLIFLSFCRKSAGK